MKLAAIRDARSSSVATTDPRLRLGGMVMRTWRWAVLLRGGGGHARALLTHGPQDIQARTSVQGGAREDGRRVDGARRGPARAHGRAGGAGGRPRRAARRRVGRVCGRRGRRGRRARYAPPAECRRRRTGPPRAAAGGAAAARRVRAAGRPRGGGGGVGGGCGRGGGAPREGARGAVLDPATARWPAAGARTRGCRAGRARADHARRHRDDAGGTPRRARAAAGRSNAAKLCGARATRAARRDCGRERGTGSGAAWRRARRADCRGGAYIGGSAGT